MMTVWPVNNCFEYSRNDYHIRWLHKNHIVHWYKFSISQFTTNSICIYTRTCYIISRLNSYSLKQPSFLCSSKGLYLTFIYFDTNWALKNSQFIVNSLKLLCWHSKHLTNVLQKHTYYTPLYGKIHLHFNIPIFQSSLIIISSV